MRYYYYIIISGNHTCFVCKKSGRDTRRCAMSPCGKFYHEECVRPFQLAKVENGSIVCPLHTCATCAADAKNTRPKLGR